MFYKADTAGNVIEATDLFSNYFKSVYATASHDEVPFTQASSRNIPILKLSAEDIRRKISTLDASKGSGPDGLPNSLLKSCVEGFLAPLVLLFNKSLQTGHFPSLWKISHIIPIHKSGSKLNVENYRGVAILSAIPKLFEALVYDNLYPWIEEGISDTQHGFLKKRSTVTNLAEFASKTALWMADGFQVDTVYTDMSKAFDVVSIEPLLAVLRKLGINGVYLEWIRSYLSHRVQYVKLNGTTTEPFFVESGVTQGSHVGPLLFICVMNELPGYIDNAHILIYADDVKLFVPVNCVKDCLNLQRNLQRFVEFCSTYGLKVNKSKCKIITYTRKLNWINFEYQMEDVVIERVSSTCDLGVEMDSKLMYTDHIDKVVSKANSLFGMIKRLCYELDDPYTIMAIYKSIVRSGIEYANIVWKPIYDIHRNRLENVQKKFVMYAVRNLPWREYVPDYRDICMLLAMDTLSSRRNLTDVFFLKDLLDGKYYSPYLLLQVTRYTGRTGLRRDRQFHIANRVQNYARNEPIYRMMKFINDNREKINTAMSKEKIKYEVMRL